MAKVVYEPEFPRYVVETFAEASLGDGMIDDSHWEIEKRYNSLTGAQSRADSLVLMGFRARVVDTKED